MIRSLVTTLMVQGPQTSYTAKEPKDKKEASQSEQSKLRTARQGHEDTAGRAY